MVQTNAATQEKINSHICWYDNNNMKLWLLTLMKMTVMCNIFSSKSHLFSNQKLYGME